MIVGGVGARVAEAAIKTGAQAPAGAAPFSSVMRTMMSETSGLEDKAQKAVTGLMDGSGVELHEAMIATQKADMAFELALQVRNKAVAAYQQMMSMQF